MFHLLAACFRVPELDCIKYNYAGKLVPPEGRHDNVCTRCFVVQDPEGSSGTDTSSSSAEEG